VVQQSSGAVGASGGRMMVNAPGDRFEQEADAAARQAVRPVSTAKVQRDVAPDEMEDVQAKALQREAAPDEDEELQSKGLQRQELPEDEEQQLAQKQEMEDEEEGEV
jgi:hypothetical protein